jgi:hypothetical protein
MPRKPLTAKSKLLTDLERGNGAGEAPQPKERLRLTSPKRKPPKLKNFRLADPDLVNLRRIVRAVQDISPHRQISETAIVKALLYLGTELAPEQIRDALKETL